MGVKVAEDVETNIKKQVKSESKSEEVFHETEERPIKSQQNSRVKNRGWSSTEIDNVTSDYKWYKYFQNNNKYTVNVIKTSTKYS